MKLITFGSLLLIATGAVWSATVPFSFDCSTGGGFVMNPQEHNRVGYITDFVGGGLTLTKDLQVTPPFTPTYPPLRMVSGTNGHPATANVIGVVENFTWAGGIADSIAIQFYVSQKNADLLKSLMGQGSTQLSSIGWWIGNYDPETKAWFEQATPSSSLIPKAIIQGSAGQPSLNVDMTPVPMTNGINLSLHKILIQIAPQPHTAFMLSFASSATKKVTMPWGKP